MPKTKVFELTIKEYADKALSSSVYPGKGNNLIYPVFGLIGETGEVAEKLKKLIRDKGTHVADLICGIVSEEDRKELADELGDILWYLNAVCYELSIDLEVVAARNLEKLRSRKERGVLHGNGDNR